MLLRFKNRNTNLGDAAVVDGKLTNIAGFAVEVVENFPDGVVPLLSI
ncbi:hypothetical protein KF7HA_02334 [Lactococcus lactis]|nr:hypothetical protein [Lactococcus lactis]